MPSECPRAAWARVELLRNARGWCARRMRFSSHMVARLAAAVFRLVMARPAFRQAAPALTAVSAKAMTNDTTNATWRWRMLSPPGAIGGMALDRQAAVRDPPARRLV